MSESFDIQAYMTAGVESVVKDALKATLKDPRESVFMLKFAKDSARASKLRAEKEAQGEHVPPFLIASITSACNLHCAGCYSRTTHATVDEKPKDQLSGEDWKRIFDEASELGISFILLAGGEPLLRKDVIQAAGERSDILFPIFTNGIFVTSDYLDLFDRKRNLIPVFSIEGNKETTDARRGEGVYDSLIETIDRFHEKNLIFGASVTVTTENVKEVTSSEFLNSLSSRGCKLVIFVEFVPVTDDSSHLAPGDKERDYLAGEILRLRKEAPEMVYVSFPGDEKSSGGCIAAGRGFFHINSHGGAEPCPFSPYSDISVKDTSLKQALQSPLFTALQENHLLDDDHDGGCVLYEKRDQVELLLQKTQGN